MRAHLLATERRHRQHVEVAAEAGGRPRAAAVRHRADEAHVVRAQLAVARRRVEEAVVGQAPQHFQRGLRAVRLGARHVHVVDEEQGSLAEGRAHDLGGARVLAPVWQMVGVH